MDNNLKYNKRGFSLLIDLIILFVVSLIPITWFKAGCFIASGDVAQYLDISNLMKFFPWAWSERIAAGEHCLHTNFSLPIGYFWLILKSAGFHLITIEKMWVFCTFFFSSLSMYYFMKVFLNDNKSRAPLFTGIFYTYNLFLVVAPLIVQYNLAPIYMFGPLTAGLWLRGLRSDTFRKKSGYAGLFALSSLLYAHSNVNMPHVAAFFVIIIILTFYNFIFNSKSYIKDILFMILAGFLYLMINLWWIIGSFSVMVNISDVVQSTRSGWHLLNATHLCDAFRNLGFWAWTHKHMGLFYFPYHGNYDTWIMLIISYGLIFIALTAIVWKRKQALFPAILLIAGLFLAKGANGPLGFIYKWCWENVYGLWVFREPWSKFTHINVFAFAMLLGIALNAVYEKLRTWKDSAGNINRTVRYIIRPVTLLFPVIAIFLILFNSYPAITGELIWDQYNYNVRSMHVKVPKYWPQIGKWFKENDPNARVFLLPKTGYAKAPYDWESGFTSANTAAISFLPNQLAYWTDFPRDRAQLLFNNVFKLFYEEPRDDTVQILRMLGVKYVIQQNDVSWKFTVPDAVPHEELKNVLAGVKDLTPLRSFGKLDVYEISHPLPIIYPVRKVTILDDAGEDLFELNTQVLSSAPILFLKDQTAKFDISKYAGAVSGPEDVDQLEHSYSVKGIKRVNPVKYIVDIDASSPFWLIFNESYNSGWKARMLRGSECGFMQGSVLKDMVFGKLDSNILQGHFCINGYANGWYIRETGKYRVVIEYTPQGIYELAKIISWFFGLICVIVAVNKRNE